MDREEVIEVERRLKAVVAAAKAMLLDFCRTNKDLTRLSKTIDVKDADYITVDYDA